MRAQPADEDADLLGEHQPQSRQRGDQDEGRQHRDERGRPSGAAAPLARQAHVQRMQKDGEKRSPGERSPERHEHPQQHIAQNHDGRDREGAPVES
jgi:hypothetical protein